MKQRPKYVLHPVLALVAGCAWACGAIDANVKALLSVAD